MTRALIDEHAIVAPDQIGGNAAVGAYTVVAAGAVIGAHATIGTHAVIGPAVRIGRGVVVGNGAMIDGATIVEDDTSIGPRACVGGTAQAADGLVTVIGAGASIGAGATLTAGIEIGQGAIVAEGAVVTRSVPRSAMVAGNPADITGYVNAENGQTLEPIRRDLLDDEPSIRDTAVRGVQIHRLPVARDLRGSLVAGELDDRLPFVARRFFVVFGVPSTEVRGEHAHYACHQFLVCIHGRVHVIADDGERREEVVLDDNRTGLYLPPMTWGTQYRYSADCSLLVLASDPYDADDYIRNYEDFLVAARTAERHG